jgi:uroporphyrinogen III methyltransferase/synthase
MKAPGRVYLVGAGPGALDLVTLRARELIESADVLVYDYLCNPEMLQWARPDAEKIYAGKSGAKHTLTQEEIHALLLERARAGLSVVRLKGGDPYVFGRGGEEAQILAAAQIPFEEVPGITSAIAAPAYAGIPVTHRDFASTVTFVTGHEDPTKLESAVDWHHLARLRGTKVFLMGMERLREIAERLQGEGASPLLPVALVRWGSTPRQESLVGTLATIADLADGSGFRAPAIIVVGEVVRLRHELNWFETLPLFGQRVVVTRTRAQASELTRKLARLGADVLEIPTIKIVPQKLGAPERSRLKEMSQFYHWLVFTSPKAVDLFFAEYFAVNPDVRGLGSIRIAVVGPATRRKLAELHLQAEVQPEIFTTEELARCFPAKAISGCRFCLPQGRLADDHLARHLRAGGGVVDEWTLYDTVPADDDVGGARGRYEKEGAHGITFTSSSTVENWHALHLHPATGSPRPKIISMGPVTSETLTRLGYSIAAQAPEATIDSLVETVRRAL